MVTVSTLIATELLTDRVAVPPWPKSLKETFSVSLPIKPLLGE